MRYEEITDYTLRSRLEGVIATLPLQSMNIRYQIKRLELVDTHSEAGSLSYLVEVGYDMWLFRGLLILGESMGIFLPDAATSYFFATGYTDESLRTYNAGYDPRYRGM